MNEGPPMNICLAILRGRTMFCLPKPPTLSHRKSCVRWFRDAMKFGRFHLKSEVQLWVRTNPVLSTMARADLFQTC